MAGNSQVETMTIKKGDRQWGNRQVRKKVALICFELNKWVSRICEGIGYRKSVFSRWNWALGYIVLQQLYQFEKVGKSRDCFHWWSDFNSMSICLKESKISLNNILKSIIPPWIIKKPKVNSTKQKLILALNNINSTISKNTIPNTSTCLQMAPRTMMNQHIPPFQTRRL